MAAPRGSLSHLRRDPVLAGVIERVGSCRWRARAEGTHFEALTRSIVYQQLAGKAAATILGRVHDLFGGRAPRPAELLKMPDAKLRGAGLSRQKLGYLKDLAERAAIFRGIDAKTDEQVVTSLTSVKGVGLWTAQMFLMFRLGRPDVLPVGDLGIQNAIKVAWKLKDRPSPAKVAEIGAKWTPYASVASWYLWRSLDP
jgi:DNA-3-methyladenine glycosylase II